MKKVSDIVAMVIAIVVALVLGAILLGILLIAAGIVWAGVLTVWSWIL